MTAGPHQPAEIVVGSFTPSVLLDVARSTGRLEAVGPEGDRGAGDVLARSVPFVARRRARRGPDQPRQRPCLPLQPEQPARRAGGGRAWSGPSTAAWAWVSTPGRVWAPRSCEALASAWTSRPRASPWRCTPSPTRSGVPGSPTSSPRWARPPDGSRPSWPATATRPCSTPATSWSPRPPGAPAWSRPRDVCAPYLGHGARHRRRAAPRRRRPASRSRCSRPSTAILAGELADEVVAAAAARRLGLDDALALRYVDRMRDADEGLVADGAVDPPRSGPWSDLRRRYLPELVDGADVLECAPSTTPGSCTPDDAGLRTRERVDHPAAPADHLRQHPRPVRDAADAGRHRA